MLDAIALSTPEQKQNMELKIPETPENASINRVMIVDLPGLSIDKEVRGQKAYHLLSSLAVVAYAKDYRDALKLPEAYSGDSEPARRQIPLFIEECLQNGDAEALTSRSILKPPFT